MQIHLKDFWIWSSEKFSTSSINTFNTYICIYICTYMQNVIIKQLQSIYYAVVYNLIIFNRLLSKVKIVGLTRIMSRWVDPKSLHTSLMKIHDCIYSLNKTTCQYILSPTFLDNYELTNRHSTGIGPNKIWRIWIYYGHPENITRIWILFLHI